MSRFTIAAALALLCGGAVAQTASTATQTVDTMNKLWGRHPGTRANHAKGVVAEGSFKPAADAAALSSAGIFAGATVPVLVRFSDSTGLPALPDGDPNANPHGMSIRFQQTAADYVDVVSNSLKFFPVANGEEFLELLQAVGDSPADAPHPNKLEQFIAAHPSVPKAFGSTSTPSSFAREEYFGIDAFIFSNAKGEKQPFRFQFLPVEGVDHVSAEAAGKMVPDGLLTELPEHLAKGPASFRVMAQLANPGDQTKDPSQPWPADRRVVELGTITLTGPVADEVKASRDLRFLPNHLQPGIEVSDDPLIDARVRSYVISFGRRAQ